MTRPIVANVLGMLLTLCGCASPQPGRDVAPVVEETSFEAQVQRTATCVLQPKMFLRGYFENPPRTDEGLVPSDALRTQYNVHVDVTDAGDHMLTVAPMGIPPTQHIFYWHGGAYVLGKMGLTDEDESIVRRLVDETQARVSYIDYPVAPEHNAATAFARLTDAYALALSNDDLPVAFVGESAGGGLALAFGQQLRDDGHPSAPTRMVLFSPWLDVSLANPDIDDMEAFDCLLDRETLQWTGAMWADDVDIDHPMVSPLLGDVDGLGRILVFVSLHELMLPDVLALAAKAESSDDVSVQVDAYPDLPHVWFKTDLPETEMAWATLRRFLRDP